MSRVDWRPPMAGTEADLAVVMADARRVAGNAEAMRRMLAVRPQLVDVVPAADALGLQSGEFLHAGPPIDWDRASGPLRGALLGAAAFEGLVEQPDEALTLFASGRFALDSCHDRHAVGPMAGVLALDVGLRTRPGGIRGAVVLLAQRRARPGPALRRVLPRGDRPAALDGRRARPRAGHRCQAPSGPIDLAAIIAQMVQMGDEGHNRNRAGTLILLRELLPSLVGSGLPSGVVAEAARFSPATTISF